MYQEPEKAGGANPGSPVVGGVRRRKRFRRLGWAQCPFRRGTPVQVWRRGGGGWLGDVGLPRRRLPCPQRFRVAECTAMRMIDGKQFASYQ